MHVIFSADYQHLGLGVVRDTRTYDCSSLWLVQHRKIKLK